MEETTRTLRTCGVVGREDLDWMLLDEGADHWRVVVTAIISVRFPYEAENIVTVLRGC
jgi:hypothetical protein